MFKIVKVSYVGSQNPWDNSRYCASYSCLDFLEKTGTQPGYPAGGDSIVGYFLPNSNIVNLENYNTAYVGAILLENILKLPGFESLEFDMLENDIDGFETSISKLNLISDSQLNELINSGDLTSFDRTRLIDYAIFESNYEDIDLPKGLQSPSLDFEKLKDAKIAIFSVEPLKSISEPIIIFIWTQETLNL